jgi:magnesium-transporting ATPase (P-type)
MFLKTWRLITIILAALTMGSAYCHVLELPAKMGYDGSFYTMINQSLYWGFGHIGGFIEAATVFLAAPALTFLVRKRRPAFNWTLAGAIFLALAFMVFLGFTEPMNREIFQWTPQSVPTNWMQVRNQWEYSHATRFVLQLTGLGALLISVLVETSTEQNRDRAAQQYATSSRTEQRT